MTESDGRERGTGNGATRERSDGQEGYGDRERQCIDNGNRSLDHIHRS